MRLARDERGFVLITAMLVLGIFLALSVAMVAVVDVQTDQTGHERSGETAFNLATSALQVEAYQLQLNWPASAPGQASCSSTNSPGAEQESSVTTECAAVTTRLEGNLQAATSPQDYLGTRWQVKVFDDDATDSADYAVAPKTTPYDANANNSMWVWATAKTADGQIRTVVERVTRRLEATPLPENVVTAGGLYTISQGTPPIIDATDQASGVTGPVDVRCGSAASEPPETDCLDWAKPSQLNPESAYQGGYVDPGGGSSALTSEQVQSLIQQARAAGTLYDQTSEDPTATAGCPPDDGTYSNPAAGSHPVVVVEGAGECTLKTQWFSESTPGALVFLKGSVSLEAPQNKPFHGLLYMVNEDGVPPSSGPVCTASDLSNASTLVTVSGSAMIDGAVVVDGCGLVDLKDNGDALNFSLDALETLQVYSAATVPGSFRAVTQ